MVSLLSTHISERSVVCDILRDVGNFMNCVVMLE